MRMVDLGGPSPTRPIHEMGGEKNQGWRSFKRFAPLGEVKMSQTISSEMGLLNEKVPETVPQGSKKKNKLRIKKVSVMTRATADDSDSEGEYESNATPGPGSYDLQSSRRDFRS